MGPFVFAAITKVFWVVLGGSIDRDAGIVFRYRDLRCALANGLTVNGDLRPANFGSLPH